MTVRALLAVSAVLFPALVSVPAHAGALSRNAVYVRDCLVAAGNVHHEPPSLLVVLLNVEGGRLGAVTPNTNGTVDIGPMQVNDVWVPKVAEHWRTNKASAYAALRDSFCANVEAGAWILRMGLDEARGDLWGGVAYYHSHNPVHQRTYLKSVLDHALKLQGQAKLAVPPPPEALAGKVAARMAAGD